jgi:hypothetical protein
MAKIETNHRLTKHAEAPPRPDGDFPLSTGFATLYSDIILSYANLVVSTGVHVYGIKRA